MPEQLNNLRRTQRTRSCVVKDTPPLNVREGSRTRAITLRLSPSSFVCKSYY